MSHYLPFAPVLGLLIFVGFWCLIVKLLALIGWRRLACFRVVALPLVPRFRLSRASIGGISYRSNITARVSAEGLSMETMFLFKIGHPPLLIPWSAIGPFSTEKFLWLTFYKTHIQTSYNNTVSLGFANDDLMSALKPWLKQRL
jgi:hypothetical protein